MFVELDEHAARLARIDHVHVGGHKVQCLSFNGRITRALHVKEVDGSALRGFARLVQNLLDLLCYLGFLKYRWSRAHAADDLLLDGNCSLLLGLHLNFDVNLLLSDDLSEQVSLFFSGFSTFTDGDCFRDSFLSNKYSSYL